MNMVKIEEYEPIVGKGVLHELRLLAERLKENPSRTLIRPP